MEYYAGKRVYITGGSSGIGLDAARLLVSYGASVAIFARDGKKLLAAQEELENRRTSNDQKIYSSSMDVSDDINVGKRIKTAVEEFGAPDVVINSAGIGHADYFENMDYATFHNVIMINLIGVRNVTAAALPFMKERGGDIANVSSMIGLIPLFGYSAYGAAKSALVGFSECLRPDLKRYNIRVSVFCPPEVDTPMTDYMLKTSPAETRALVRLAGLMKPGRVARILLAGIRKRRFLIIPGFLANLQYMNRRFFPATARMVMDLVVAAAAKRAAKKP